MPAQFLPYIATGLGALGTFFGDFGQETEAEQMLTKQAKYGINSRILAAMRRRARNAIGNQSSALRVSQQQSLMRQNAPIAKQQEVLDKINTRGLGAIGSALSEIDLANEQYKMQALGQLAGIQKPDNYGAGFAQLFGAGLQGLLTPPNPAYGNVSPRNRNVPTYTF